METNQGSPPPALWTEDVAAGYGEANVLDQVSLRVRPGELVAVIGANGAGKSTLLRAIYGLLPLRKGRVWVSTHNGQFDITRLRPHERTKLGLNYVPQVRDVFPTMSVRENLELGAYRNWSQLEENIARVVEVFPLLRNRFHQKAGSLSGGERRSLAVARALMSKPKVLLLDEPSAGVAPIKAHELLQQLAVLATEGMGLVVVEQNATRALQLASYAYVMEMGRIRFEGPGVQLAQDPRIIELYLGTVRSSRRGSQRE